MKKTLIFIVFLVSTIFGVNSREPLTSQSAFELFLNDFNTLVSKKYGVVFVGKTGELSTSVERFLIFYESAAQHDTISATTLVKNVTNDFLKEINSNKEIRPYLKKYPFDREEMIVQITFHKNTETISGISSNGYNLKIYKQEKAQLTSTE